MFGVFGMFMVYEYMVLFILLILKTTHEQPDGTFDGGGLMSFACVAQCQRTMNYVVDRLKNVSTRIKGNICAGHVFVRRRTKMNPYI